MRVWSFCSISPVVVSDLVLIDGRYWQAVTIVLFLLQVVVENKKDCFEK